MQPTARHADTCCAHSLVTREVTVPVCVLLILSVKSLMDWENKSKYLMCMKVCLVSVQCGLLASSIFFAHIMHNLPHLFGVCTSNPICTAHHPIVQANLSFPRCIMIARSTMLCTSLQVIYNKLPVMHHTGDLKAPSCAVKHEPDACCCPTWSLVYSLCSLFPIFKILSLI